MDIATTFAITDTRLYIPVVTLSTQDNAKLLQQLKLGFRIIINWNKHQSKVTIQRQIQYLNYLIDPSLQEVNRIFVLSFEDAYDRTGHAGYFPRKVEMKECNVMINEKNQ